jgi:hypothetical protein
MSDSILATIKKMVGLDESYTAFDTDITLLINSAFSKLYDVGVGPVDGFVFSEDTSNWADFLDPGPQLNDVKNYIYLFVRSQFDPPGTGYGTEAMAEQIKEHLWRISERREFSDWVNPEPVVVVDDVFAD